MNYKKETYIWIDVLKLIFAIGIVLGHTFGPQPVLAYINSGIGVPFFFIASGFFYAKGLIRNNNSREYVKKHTKRLIILYTTWTVVTLPIMYYNLSMVHPNSSLFDSTMLFKLVYLLRAYFLSGSCGVYWFLLTLIYSCLLIHLSFNKKWIFYILCLLSLTGFHIGYLYNSVPDEYPHLYTFIHTTFSSTRNFANVGLFYMCIGAITALLEIKINQVFCIIPLALYILAIKFNLVSNIYYNNIIPPISIFIAGIILKTAPKLIETNAKTMRELSIIIYLVHFPFLLVFDFYLTNGYEINFPLALFISIFIYFIIKKFIPNKYASYFLG